MQEIQITGTSFLDDEEAQSYMGKIGLVSKVFIFLVHTIRCSRCSYIYKLSDFLEVCPYTYKLDEILASVRHP